MSDKILHTMPGDASFGLFRDVLAEVYPQSGTKPQYHDGMNKDFLHTCLVYIKENKPVGRLALYFNPFMRFKEEKAACIGNYECIDDPEIAKALISHAEEISKQNSFRHILGPINGSTWDSYRFSEHNEHSNFFLEPYHHIYYNEHFVSSGLSPAARYSTMRDTSLDHDMQGVKQREKELRDSGVTFRNIDPANYSAELDQMHEFCMRAFSNNFLFTPVSLETFKSKYLPLQPFIKAGNVTIAEHEGRTVGLAFCVDDLYSAEPVLILKTVARDMDPLYKGLGNVLTNTVTRYAKQNNYKSVLHAFMLETNTSLAISKAYSGKHYKQYLLYSKRL